MTSNISHRFKSLLSLLLIFILPLFTGPAIAHPTNNHILPRSPDPHALTSRQSGIPGAPADPPQPAGDGSGPWKAESAGWHDYWLKAKYRGVAAAANVKGMSHAGGNMNHYLDNTGADLTVAPEDLMRDLANFKTAAHALAQNSAKAAYGGADSSKTFSTPWQVYGYGGAEPGTNFNADWFYGTGAFSYSVQGVVSANKASKATLQYVVRIFDRYNWDGGKSTDIYGINIKDEELGRLHKVGIAREYVVRGSSKVMKVDDYDPNKTLPQPDLSGGGRG